MSEVGEVEEVDEVVELLKAEVVFQGTVNEFNQGKED